MTIDILPKNRCSGCAACFNVCPVNAITMTENEMGFFEPVIDKNICVECGKCEKVCPVLHVSHDNATEPDCLAVWAEDSLRLDSSSGGVFSLLAEYILSKGGYVCGAVLDDNFFVSHKIVNEVSGVKSMRRSKYVMSWIGDNYKKIKDLLDEDKLVLFSGCPCQVNGLKNFLGKTYVNLLLVDIVCHGAPSQKIFRKYLEETYGIENLAGFKFRTKRYGYNCFTQIATLKNGEEVGRDYSFDYYEKVMHTGLASKDICLDCPFAPAPRQGDITIGDFWGIAKYDEKLNDGLGTSLVLLNNSWGKEIFSKIQKRIKMLKRIPFDFAKQNNRFGRKINAPNGRRWFNTMIKSQSFEKSAKYALKRRFNIGVIGLWYGRNYGSMVTYYALNYVLTKEMNQSVLMIENCLRGKEVEISKTSPRKIAQEFYDISARRNVDEMSSLNFYCDSYIVGSDQLWNANLSRPYKQTYFLGFADDNNKKISYGTSFGIPYTGTEQEKLISSYNLRRFDYVSVRDDMSKEICEKDFGVKNVAMVCDPTFLCPVEEYSRLAKKSNLKYGEKYILAYILDPTAETGALLERISRDQNVKIYVILDEPPHLWEQNLNKLSLKENSTVEVKREVDLFEWLWYYEHAQSVITDSFHGTIFSIIFKKPFVTKINKRRGAQRFVSLLQPLELMDRLFSDLQEIEAHINIINELDYTVPYEKLDKIKEYSYNWLKTAVDAKNYNVGDIDNG
ncbi:MAG: polysaccharide pyruvyl transferase family protein [Clostridia bacterium]|nr:polysaccharide pyruvyl transferase family protein [Clostridia bacterium]